MRGYMEEAYAVSTPWDSVQGEGVLADGTPYGYTNFELLGACGHGAFAYRDGKPAVWFIASQLCNMGNSEEFEYLIPPLFHLWSQIAAGLLRSRQVPRRYWTDHRALGGRTGSAPDRFTRRQCLFVQYRSRARHDGRLSLAGRSGGHCARHQSAGTDSAGHHAHHLAGAGGAACVWPAQGRQARNLEVRRADHNLKDDEYLGGNGRHWRWLRHPLERDPLAVLADANAGQVPAEFAENLYGVVLSRRGAGYCLNAEATQAKRTALRAERRAQSLPVRQWWQHGRNQVLEGSMPDAVREMYRSSTSFAEYRTHFRDFWQLPVDFEI